MKRLYLFLLLFLTAGVALQAQKKSFRFEEGKFRIAQFTDIHWAVGSPKCAETVATIQGVLRNERPQLALLTGDVVTTDPAIEGWQAVISIFEEARMPFAVMMGNHDAEHMTKDSIYALLEQSPWYVGERGPEELSGMGNCVLPVQGADGRDEAVLYLIDSNDYPVNKSLGFYDWIHADQIGWYCKQSARFKAANGGKPLPALAFCHIPVPEYRVLAEHPERFGYYLEGEVADADLNSGFFASMVDMGDVMGLFCGHDHNNDFIGLYKNLALAYGRATGADAYGELERGARIIDLYENEFRFDTWVVTPSGRGDTWYYPSGMNSGEERDMTYLPALKQTTKGLKHGVAYIYREGTCKKVEQIAECPVVKQGVMPRISIKEAAADDHFAYEFRTLIDIPVRGIYRFYTYSDDGSVLLVDGQKVVDNDGGHSARRAAGKVALEAGLHELRLLYFEDYMGQTLEVSYSSRFDTESLLPEDRLYVPLR